VILYKKKARIYFLFFSFFVGNIKNIHTLKGMDIKPVDVSSYQSLENTKPVQEKEKNQSIFSHGSNQ
jgi:hypothetical protein